MRNNKERQAKKCLTIDDVLERLSIANQVALEFGMVPDIQNFTRKELNAIEELEEAIAGGGAMLFKFDEQNELLSVKTISEAKSNEPSEQIEIPFSDICPQSLKKLRNGLYGNTPTATDISSGDKNYRLPAEEENYAKVKADEHQDAE